MFYFNQAAAEARPSKRAAIKFGIDAKVQGYQAACARGKQLAEQLRPVFEQKLNEQLNYEAKLGTSRCQAIIDAEVAKLEALQAKNAALLG